MLIEFIQQESVMIVVMGVMEYNLNYLILF